MFTGSYLKVNQPFFATVLVFSISLLGACSNGKKYIFPERKEIVESVYASATIKAASQYSAFSQVTGILKENLVVEGDSVSAGQVIAQIDNSNPALNAENAQLALNQAKQNMNSLNDLKAQIETLRKQHQLDSLNYSRQQQLWSQNIGSRAQLEQRQFASEASANALQSALVRYRQSYGQLKTALEQAENNYRMTLRSSNDFNVTSAISGRVYTLNYEPGELVTIQKPVALIGKSGDFILEMTVDEVDISRISLDQKVILSMDAFKDQVFRGSITKIYPNLDPRSQSFIVEARFIDKPSKLYPGMSAEASIVVSEKRNCLVIPVSYLTEDGKVKTADGEVAVKTGLKNLEVVEILSGIDEKTKLLRP